MFEAGWDSSFQEGAYTAIGPAHSHIGLCSIKKAFRYFEKLERQGCQILMALSPLRATRRLWPLSMNTHHSRATTLRLVSLLQHNICPLNMTLFPGVALVTGAASGRVIPFVTTANTDELQALAKQQQSPSSAKAARRLRSQTSTPKVLMRQQS